MWDHRPVGLVWPHVLWFVALVAAAILARWTFIIHLDRAVSHALRGLGDSWPPANLIWVLGGLPLTSVGVLAWLIRRRPYGWRGLWAFAMGLVCEVALKIAVHTPFPKPTPEPSFYAHLEMATNVTPQLAFRWLSRLGGHAGRVGTGRAIFHGSFPSGHVYRLTYALGLWFQRWPVATWVVAALAGLLVVATGGHWAIDVIGGFALARLMLWLAMSPTADLPQ